MAAPLPIVLVSGLLVTARLYTEQIPHLWRYGPVTVADHTRQDSMAAIARSILADSRARFALAGLSMGGYVALEIMRQAPERVDRLALLDTTARPDEPAITARRRKLIELAQAGRFAEVIDVLFALFVHAARRGDERLRATVELMAHETGVETFVRQQTAIIGRPDLRPDLAAIDCPTLVLVGDSDALTPPELAAEIASAVDGARLVTVRDSGHLTPLIQPEQVTQALIEWLQA
jgi:pimeloyl-ACP methyl ester carboxylesterase